MLRAISPIDGRYAAKTAPLADYFSEYALIHYRVKVEIAYFIKLLDVPEIKLLADFPREKISELQAIASAFSEADAEHIKSIEKKTNHDVKAVEYFLKEKFSTLSLGKYSEMIHFGLTSQDINNTAIPLSLKDCLNVYLIPLLQDSLQSLRHLQEEWSDVPMLARTHGQPASPTRLGKEIHVFSERLEWQVEQFKGTTLSAKFGGATGNFNAHHVAFPEVDWIHFSNDLIQSLGLERQHVTTQIDNYDDLAATLQNAKRINTILIDLCRDVWTYISLNYFGQKTVAGEIGSSAMPHKVNPIDFENAEGNLGVANALFTHLADKLPISRLQRDLTDSTVLRNLGVPFGHMAIALTSLQKGLGKLTLNQAVINSDLENNWAVVAEAYQTILRREGIENPYELLKDLTRGKAKIGAEDMTAFIDNLDVGEELKAELRRITPQNYTGVIG